jgi:hypothetical protein
MSSKLDRNQKAPDRIPIGAIRLSAAFDLAYRAATPEWEWISSQCERWDGLGPDQDDPCEDPYRLRYESTIEAEKLFRNALTNGVLSAYICDQTTGVVLELEPRDWYWLGNGEGIVSDYPSPTDPRTPGPNCTIEEVPQPVFLMREPLDAWLKTISDAATDQGDRDAADQGDRDATAQDDQDAAVQDDRDAADQGGRDFVLDFKDAGVRRITDDLRSGHIVPYIVAYFLRDHIDGVPNGRLTKQIDYEITVLLQDLKLRSAGARRDTARSAYRLAMQISRLTRSPLNWRDLGVPDLTAVLKNASDRASG